MGGQRSPQDHRVTTLTFTFLVLLAVNGPFECQGQEITSDVAHNVCTLKGRVNTDKDWYGYLLQKVLKQDYAKIEYQITYPVKECCASLLIYYDNQVKEFRPNMSCEERLAVLPADNNQVIPLTTKDHPTSGCSVLEENGEEVYVCREERVFRSSIPRTWYFAVSRCGTERSEGFLNLNYEFNITGFSGECGEDVHDLNSDDVSDSSEGEELEEFGGTALALAAGEMDCQGRLDECMIHYYSPTLSLNEFNNVWNCVSMVDCSGDARGQDVKNQLVDKIRNTPIDSSSYDKGSMSSLSLVLGFVCLVLSLNR
ncbi:hypothetical protein RRG08_061993 [Elysia crispata]|uniref:GPR180-like N-terminal domain-containing protein n=1 Tax=Elysia crispata TaxID=231223 RepID=A0AAE1A4Y6_9GAST|nr:hypothetical protein RRG08_061993 [Elysia crispata]